MFSEERMRTLILRLLISACVTTAAARAKELDKPAPSNETLVDAPFWPDQPGIWFKDKQEQLADELIGMLAESDMKVIADILKDPPEMKYDAVKARLTAVREKNLGRGSTWLVEVISKMELGDQKPSGLLQRMRNLQTYANADLPYLRGMWMNKLPRNVRFALVIRESMSKCTVEDLAVVADKLMEFQAILNQLKYIQGHYTPSRLYTAMQMLESDTPDAYIRHALIKAYPSYVGTAIAIWESMNNGSTLEALAAVGDRTVNLKEESDQQLKNIHELLNVEQPRMKLSQLLNQMRYKTENLIPVHTWLYFLPAEIREAIVVKQSLDFSSNIQDLKELADILYTLQPYHTT